MAIKIESGIDWSDVIPRIENLPRGEARRISFSSGKSMAVEHHQDGTIRVLISGDDTDGQWIYPPSLQFLANILRSGCATRVMA
jgi:hypothetical protein